MEFLPDFSGTHEPRLEGFYLAINRDEKFSLPYLIGKAEEAESKKVEIISSVAFQNIAGSKTLKEAVQHMIKYLKDEFKVTQDDIVDMLKKVQISEILLVERVYLAKQP